MTDAAVRVGVAEHIATITLNRPEKRNALSTATMRAILDALAEADANPDVRAIILTGAGGNFCAGADIAEFQEQLNWEMMQVRERATLSMLVHKRIPTLTKPVIAAVQGYALAGGCGLAMACDMVVAAEDAVFGYPEVQRGFVAALVMANLIRSTGRKRAFDLIARGRRFTAAEALAFGLVNQVVPPAEVPAAARTIAADFAALAPDAVRLTKELFHRVADMPYDLALEAGRDVNVIMRQTGSFATGVAQFNQGKRQEDRA